MTQLTIVEPSTDDLADQLLALDGVFHVLIVDQHSDVVATRAKDADVSATFLHSFRDAAMRLSIIRTAGHVDRDPTGTLHLAFLEYDRVAVLLLPDGDHTIGIALLKEHATGAFLDDVRAIIAHAHTP